MSRARPLTEQEAPELFASVRNLTQAAALPMPSVHLIQSEQPNAFATGRNPQHAAIAVTEGLLRTLSRDELEGVLAHEIAHVGNRDILISSIAATIAGAISWVGTMARWGAIFGGSDDDEGGGFLGVFVTSIVAGMAAVIVQLAISRSREYHHAAKFIKPANKRPKVAPPRPPSIPPSPTSKPDRSPNSKTVFNWFFTVASWKFL